VLCWSAIVMAGIVGLGALYAGFTIYEINRDVHHVGISSALLAKGQNDLLVAVSGPDHHEQIYVLHDDAGHTNVLQIPSNLDVKGADGRSVPLSSFRISAPSLIISGLRQLGIPIGRYIGVDLHAVSPTSALGQVATGKIAITSLLADPTHLASLAEAIASHVYLGPNVSLISLLSLTHIPLGQHVNMPTARDATGHVVMAVPLVHVLRAFL
jgi:hypothetical protein